MSKSQGFKCSLSRWADLFFICRKIMSARGWRLSSSQPVVLS
jgi:hypothetical protein